jgi:hypothetical protein
MKVVLRTKTFPWGAAPGGNYRVIYREVRYPATDGYPLAVRVERYHNAPGKGSHKWLPVDMTWEAVEAEARESLRRFGFE